MSQPSTTQVAKDIQRKFGSNYYTATLLLPRQLREEVFIFYAFVRLADEIVDNATSSQQAKAELEKFSYEWDQAYTAGASTNNILNAFASVCKAHNITYQETLDFLSAMKQDLEVTRYETYKDLQEYMYGSAEVIGLMLTKLFGCTDDNALPHAQALGEAMQLTNFLRDIYEDLMERNRIYLPQNILSRHGVTEELLRSDRCNEQVRAVVKELATKAHRLYQQANAGISLLPRPARPAVRVASALYEEILYELKRRNYCVQKEKIRFSKLKKLKIALLYGYVKTN